MHSFSIIITEQCRFLLISSGLEASLCIRPSKSWPQCPEMEAPRSKADFEKHVLQAMVLSLQQVPYLSERSVVTAGQLCGESLLLLCLNSYTK